MCGINGIVRLTDAAPSIDRDELLRTREAMISRGPDGAGLWISDDGRAALASRRLAIIDLTPAGEQPMASEDGRLQIVLNGEIYNFLELRRELEAEGVRFRSRSDTEVVLALYAREQSAMLSRLRGMYGLAIWDDREKTLLLARDPLGIKPLYFSTEGGCLRFASQVKALERGGAISQDVDPTGLAAFLLWGSVPEPHTIRRAVHSLRAGHHLVVRDGRIEPFGLHGPKGVEPLGPPAAGNSIKAHLELNAAAVEDSVKAHLVSDVPIAIFLSAGLDSGLVAALASRNLAEPLRTFTLRFEGLEGTVFDEGPLAAEVAKRLGAQHSERWLAREELPALWEGALAAMDQPSIDGFNTWAVSRAAHQEGLKVVLSGLGGDEKFGSYPSFTQVPLLAGAVRSAAWIPGLAASWPAVAKRVSPGRPKLAGLLHHGRTIPGAYYLRRGLFLPEELPGLLGRDLAEEALRRYDPVADVASRALANGEVADGWIKVHRMEIAHYMRNQLLRDSDWASMAWSVELRAPLVDAWLLKRLEAGRFKLRRKRHKVKLVRYAAPELPPRLSTRPKSGFYIPVAEWMQPELAALRPGERSRWLALRVLEGFGVALR